MTFPMFALLFAAVVLAAQLMTNIMLKRALENTQEQLRKANDRLIEITSAQAQEQHPGLALAPSVKLRSWSTEDDGEVNEFGDNSAVAGD